MTTSPTLVWFRSDLRLRDNPALWAAAERGEPIIPIYLWSPEDEGDWSPGGATRWWLHHSLQSLDRSLREIGQRLILRIGPPERVLRELVQETSAGAVLWNRRYEPTAVERDARIKTMLREEGIDARSFNASLLVEPGSLETKAGEPYKVFTPFWRAMLQQIEVPEPRPVPNRVPAPSHWPRSSALRDLELEPTIDWAAGIRESWQPGVVGAEARLRLFDRRMGGYEETRDRPDLEGTSRLSPHLHFGEIGPREVWHRAGRSAQSRAAGPYLRQLVWREFAHHLLFHFPQTTREPLRPEFLEFPWQPDRRSLRAWQQGRTGYPIVDAGMRELWATGWMHNRVRMVTASFLIKHLLQPWQDGARWFWDTLVDADLANNTLGWQWVAGSGADAAPYFRIFNPILQGKKFDPEGDYVRRWVPELARLGAPHIHAPWTASDTILREAGIELGKTYPEPIVDHDAARARALAAYHRTRSEGDGERAES